MIGNNMSNLTPGMGETSVLESEQNLDGNRRDIPEELEVAGSVFENYQIHPLLLPPVLTNVFNNLSPEQLAQFRLVCSLWNNESLHVWRSTATVSLTETMFAEGLKEFLASWEDDSNECDVKPFRRFDLKGWGFGLPSDTYLPRSSQHDNVAHLEHQRFWDQVGIHITSLSLRRCSFAGIEEARKVMYLVCPNLQQLNLDSCNVLPHSSSENDFHVWDDHFMYQYITNEAASYEKPAFGEHIHLKTLTLKNCLPDSWLQMLSHFSSLTTLNICGALKDPYHTPRLLEAVNIVRGRDNRELPLGHVSPLNLVYEHGQASRDSFQLLQRFGFPLGQMWASLSHHLDYGFVQRILQSHVRTLKELVLYVRTPTAFRFPDGLKFKNLETLKIRYGLSRDFHFLNDMPSLKILDVSHPDRNRYTDETIEIHAMFANTSDLEMSELKLTGLRELEIGFKMTAANLRRMVGWIPNLVKLKMQLDNVLLGIVCQHWTSLVELRDTSDELTDEGVILSIASLAGDPEDVEPIIGQLKRLTEFRTFSQHLTGLSVRNGFLKIPNLRTLTIHPGALIGTEEKKALSAKGVRILHDVDVYY